jgi:hypothetical protein
VTFDVSVTEDVPYPPHPRAQQEVALQLADPLRGQPEVAVAAREEDHRRHRRAGRAQEEERRGHATPGRDRAELRLGRPGGCGEREAGRQGEGQGEQREPCALASHGVRRS